MKIVYKILVYCILPVIAAFMTWRIYESVMEPIRNDEKRDELLEVAKTRLRCIRALNIEYYQVHENQYAPCIDSLKNFYNNGLRKTEFKFGDQDDSLYIATTKAVKDQYKKKHPKKNKKDNNDIPNDELYKMYLNGEKVFGTIDTYEPVKEYLYKQSKPSGTEERNKELLGLFGDNFSINEIFLIPNSQDTLTYSAGITNVASVDVAVFEASMTYDQLLKDMDRQYVINLNDDCIKLTKEGKKEQIRFPGIKVGDLEGREGTRGTWE